MVQLFGLTTQAIASAILIPAPTLTRGFSDWLGYAVTSPDSLPGNGRSPLPAAGHLLTFVGSTQAPA